MDQTQNLLSPDSENGLPIFTSRADFLTLCSHTSIKPFGREDPWVWFNHNDSTWSQNIPINASIESDYLDQLHDYLYLDIL